MFPSELGLPRYARCKFASGVPKHLRTETWQKQFSAFILQVTFIPLIILEESRCRLRTAVGVWRLSDLLWPSRSGKQGTREMKILLIALYSPRILLAAARVISCHEPRCSSHW